MAVELDSRRIASFVSLPEPTISTLLESPTTDLVQTFLSSLTSKIQEYEQLKSQKLKQDIELETTIRNNESKVKVLKTSVEKGLAEVGKLRTELQESGMLSLGQRLEGDLIRVQRMCAPSLSRNLLT